MNLPTGTVLVHNAAWGVQQAQVRPPFSKVYELPEAEIRALIQRPQDRAELAASSAARAIFLVIKEQCATDSHLNMSQLANLAGITSKRKLQSAVRELQEAGLVYTRTLAERGKSRVIGLVSSTA